jgi:hypothetical protein
MSSDHKNRTVTQRVLSQHPHHSDRIYDTVKTRNAMPIASVMAAANMRVPITSNTISLKDIAHQVMRPQPSVAAGAWQMLASEVVTSAA